MRKIILGIVGVCLGMFLLVFFLSPPKHTVLNVSCASSMAKPMEEIKKLYETEHPGIKIEFNFGGSKSLKTQIRNGAETDLFFSASKIDMEDLVKDGWIQEKNVATLAYNQLSFATHIDHTITWEDVLQLNVEQLGVANEALAPLGQYAMEYLKKQPYFQQLKDKIILANDSGSLVQWVVSGAVPVAILYRSDVLSHEKIKEVFSVPKEETTKVGYEIGLLNNRPNEKEGKSFLSFLKGHSVQSIFESYGFSPAKE